jgi:hypothetical protein
MATGVQNLTNPLSQKPIRYELGVPLLASDDLSQFYIHYKDIVIRV